MVARETGELKEAKDKLEKRVEELTWRLDIENHLGFFKINTKWTQEPRAPDSYLTKQGSLTDRQQENQDALLKCLAEDKRFEKNRPAVSCNVYNYKALLHWRSFEAEKTHIFDKIIHAIRSSIEIVSYNNFNTSTKVKEFEIKHQLFNLNIINSYYFVKTIYHFIYWQSQEGINDLAYWLSTTSTLLFYLHCTLKASNTTKEVSRNRNSPATLFGKMAQAPRSIRTRTIRGSSRNIHSNVVAKQQELQRERLPIQRLPIKAQGVALAPEITV
ncbi:Unconventional myosin-Va [Sesbania bispinosa]|nr:Unconventional myosin-Va [Sesbania bispinosa]